MGDQAFGNGDPGMSHPDEMTVELYVLGSPEAGPGRQKLSEHFEACSSCRQLRDTITLFYRDLEGTPRGSETTARNLPARTRPDTPEVRPSATPVPRDRAQVFRVVETAFPVRAARWIMRHPVASTSATLGVVGMLIFLLLPRTTLFNAADTDPANFNVRGLMVQIVNRSDSVLWTEQVNGEYARELERQSEGESSPEVRMLFRDLDGDGTNEILQVMNPGRPAKISAGELLARSSDGGTLLWKYSASRRFNFPERTEGNTPDFGIRTIREGDFDNDGKPEVYVLTAHSHFPTWIAKLDGATGKELALFLHVGHIVRMTSADLDGDGVAELIISGRNNAFRRAFVAVLDPRAISGRGPATGPYFPAGIPPAAIRSYVLFPRTVVGDAIDDGTLIEMASAVDVNTAERYLRVSITETNDLHQRGSFTVVFDRSMNAVNFQTGDDFDLLSDSLRARGRVTGPSGQEYARQYLGGLRYFSGDSWATRTLSPHFGQNDPGQGTR